MHVAHVVYRLDVGGLETVLAHLVDRLPQDRYRHTVICLTRCTGFRHRIQRAGVAFHALNKRAGQDWRVWWRLFRLLRRLRPQVVHGCNIAALEAALPAFLAGVPVRIQAEHGRDWHDLDGENRTYILLRRLLNPLVSRFVAVSRDLERWLVQRVAIPAHKVCFIGNGVDLTRFRPRPEAVDAALPWPGFLPPGAFLIITVGRFWPVKDQANLLRAFARLLQNSRPGQPPCRLLLVGGGLLEGELTALAGELQVRESVRLAGYQEDVPGLLARAHLFVLPSLAEGMPLTVLEAMAAGLAVVATRVGGVPDLVVEGETGTLVPPGDPDALAVAMAGYVADPALARRQGARGRQRVEELFSLEEMVAHYDRLYDELVRGETGR
ncbi:MAG: TIGR03088 family PEP-CTERM/XrtA system glycosyltransferase [Magnetococcales bacterium]|nr:TIGR03088 family PEP-CTERM/XrtA system glycosyltransferase [Magnetococcales bacterium]